ATRCLAIEWAPEGLRVNGVVPGPIDGTEGMARLAPTEEMRAKVAKSVPMKRLGTPEDVAQTCLYLGSDAAGYVNGVIMGADGGWSVAGASLGAAF
ncbi:MAG: SDR family oxidoreductase, partial [Pseudomonadota bacterium]